MSSVTTNDHLEFGPIPHAARSGTVVSAQLLEDDAPGTKVDSALWLFHTDITETADNTAWTPSDAEVLTCIGVVEIPKELFHALGGAGEIFTPVATGVPLTSMGETLYGQMIAENIYTPKSGETFTYLLTIEY